jgi:DNA-binding transcriptional MerR regulator
MLISDFARLGQVSVRMLRHYDALGLLVPDHVDPASGYRSYSPEQLHVLNRIVALKDLGFTLEQVRGLLDEPVGPDELRGMLRLRQAELEEEARAVGTRLAAVESRLRMIEQESTVSPDYVVKTSPALRLVAQVRTIDPGAIGENLEEMFESVAAAGLREVDGALATPVATYDMVEDGLTVTAGYAWSGPAPEGCQIVALPEQTAVCGVHLGEMARIQESWQALHRWVVDNGYDFTGPARELYVRAVPADQADWVTELQQPVSRGA